MRRETFYITMPKLSSFVKRVKDPSDAPKRHQQQQQQQATTTTQRGEKKEAKGKCPRHLTFHIIVLCGWVGICKQRWIPLHAYCLRHFHPLNDISLKQQRLSSLVVLFLLNAGKTPSYASEKERSFDAKPAPRPELGISKQVSA